MIAMRKLIVVLTVLIASSAAANAQKTETERSWNQPVAPFKIIDNIYYVGASDITSYLITTPKGHILIDSGFPETVAQVTANIAKLGFQLADVKIILNSHAHYDHAGGIAELKRLTKAKVFVSDGDAPLFRSGGLGDPNYDDKYPFEAIIPDGTFRDGKQIKLGGVSLRANITAGHTPGCTTWTTTAKEQKVKYNVAFICSTSAPGYRLIDNPKYPNIVADYQATFARLKKMPVDIFLASHGNAFDLLEKVAKLNQGGPNPFIDPAGYRAYLSQSEENFRNNLAAQRSKK
jgi:metallo-beta-lactamase class B